MKGDPWRVRLLVLFLVVFAGLVFLVEWHARNQARADIDAHALVISDALWNFNPQGADEYLRLAAATNHYDKLVVTDTTGEEFLRITGGPIGPWSRLLRQTGLLPEVKLLAHVEHGGNVIGWIEAWWVSRTLATDLYILLAMVLLFLVLQLHRRVVSAKRVLEERIRERTEELARSNTSLQQEIGERVKADNALRSSEEILRATLESLRDGVLVVDAEGRVSHTNQRFSDIWQIPDHVLATRRDSVLMRHVRDKLPDPEQYANRVATIYTSQDDTLDQVVLRDGRVIERTSTLFRKEGKASGRVWLFRDITERVRSEQDQARLQAQLTQAHKMEALGTLAGGVAHDFNNILQVIYGTMQLMGDSGLPAADRDRYLIDVRQAVERASELVQQLLSYSRQVEPGRKNLDLNDHVTQALRILERTLPRMIAIDARLAPRLRPVLADPGQLDQILMNLASNARDAMPSGGRLTVETENVTIPEGDDTTRNPAARPGDYVRLGVEDTGIGMEPEVMGRIYEPFFTTKKVGEGTGLGLFTVYGIVKAHGGWVDCTSKKDRGARFDLYFPAAEPAEREETPSEPVAEAKSPAGQETILLVDDEESIIDVASHFLGALGYRIRTADSGEAALEQIDLGGDEIDLVVLDLGMPGMGGKACLTEILRRRPGIACIIASGYASDGEERELLGNGARAFVHKPYRLRKLAATIRHALDHPENPAG